MITRLLAVRFVAVCAVVAPLSSGLVLASSPNAWAAASGISSPSDNTTYSSGSSFDVTANAQGGNALQPAPSVTLSVTGPDNFSGSASASSSQLSNGDRTLRVTVPIGSSTPNGVYNATLTRGGNAVTSRSYYTNFGVATPDGFAAQGSGARDVSFSWNKGSEPDLTGYSLSDSSGGLLADINVADSCSGSTCSHSLSYPSDNPGSHGYALVAHRSGGSGGTLTSGRATSSATLATPPRPTPTPTPGPSSSPSPGGGGGSSAGGTAGGGSSAGGTSSGGTSGGGSSAGGSSGGGTSAGGSSGGGTSAGGSSAGGTSAGGSEGSTAGSSAGPQAAGPKPSYPSLGNPVVAERRNFALQFNAFSPSLGIPKLPPLPDTLPSLTAGGEGALPMGTFAPTLDYGSRTETTKVTTTSPVRAIAAVRNVLDSEQLAKSLAGALLLLMIGAHLRRFIGSRVEE